ncbi:very-long-chain aldehyde decarbonylase GL1-5-like [Magnolia sinica]|uniref:very-long-chain aldehyde decarbonylase GL1-5-like n=1 Tax=Magnolia sinica TaxID=86752 RepID=UPI00265B4764|nr:very-long-chain aldehyde decarbonylase GL1-5-like [Magnolia sinica]
MATKPGLLTEWPWHRLGNFKYIVLAPWVVESVYSYVTKPEGERDLSNLLILPFLLWRWLHNQIWISLSRFQTARSKHRIVHKGIDFEQVDRESNWDDQIILNGTFLYMFSKFVPGSDHLPFWNTEGIVMNIFLHVGPVEFLYYWCHRALHHHYLYSRYHSHHHSSIVTEPITSVIHPFAEHLLYFVLFTIPMITNVMTRTNSIVAMACYETYIDFMNNLGHCNFEIVPNWLFRIFPPLKYLMYTPSFHSLHHTQFRTNYALFMPMYDYLYGTADKSSDSLYETSHKGNKVMPDVVHLTHPTTLHSIYHLRLGFAGFASRPYASKWYLWMIWPLTWVSMLLTWVFGSTFTVERNRLDKLKMQTWAIPRFTFQYLLSWQRATINGLIEKAILEADEGGVKVISLGLLNQGEELNRNGELYLQKHPKLKVKIVDGSSLAVAAVLNSIPQDTKQVLLRGNLTKTGYAVALALCQRDIQVMTVRRDEFEKMKLRFPAKLGSHLVLSSSYTCEVWLVGDGLREEEQRKAAKGTRFIPFSQFPPKRVRRDCVYDSTPAFVVPKALEDMHACENWLPRRVMSAWRVSGIVHGLEGWDVNECGDLLFDVEKVWSAALKHGFLPLSHA